MCCGGDKPNRGATALKARAPLSPQFSVDPFLDRTASKVYNCLDFVREVWAAMTGEDITDRFTGLTGAFRDRKVTLDAVRSLKRLQTPVDPCVVVMQRRNTVPHIGIFLAGRILHLHSRGVEFQPLIVAREYFTSIRYYL